MLAMHRDQPTGSEAAPGSGVGAGQQEERLDVMFKHPKFRQAGLIVFATTLLLILPNLGRVFG
jgi:hypothetical protein